MTNKKQKRNLQNIAFGLLVVVCLSIPIGFGYYFDQQQISLSENVEFHNFDTTNVSTASINQDYSWLAFKNKNVSVNISEPDYFYMATSSIGDLAYRQGVYPMGNNSYNIQVNYSNVSNGQYLYIGLGIMSYDLLNYSLYQIYSDHLTKNPYLAFLIWDDSWGGTILISPRKISNCTFRYILEYSTIINYLMSYNNTQVYLMYFITPSDQTQTSWNFSVEFYDVKDVAFMDVDVLYISGMITSIAITTTAIIFSTKRFGLKQNK